MSYSGFPKFIPVKKSVIKLGKKFYLFSEIIIVGNCLGFPVEAEERNTKGNGKVETEEPLPNCREDLRNGACNGNSQTAMSGTEQNQ